MRGFEVKKLVAIAAGAALVGSALAPFVAAAVQKSDVYNDDGTPKVNVAVGSKAALSDAVWAGNIAAVLASNARTTKTVQASAAGGSSAKVSDLSVDFTLGGKVSFGAGSKEYKVNLNSGTLNEIDNNTLTKSLLPHLYEETLQEKDATNGTYSITAKEEIIVTVDAKMDTSSSVKDLAARIDSEKIRYKVDLGSGIYLDESSNTKYVDSGTSDLVKIPFFGELYELNLADFNSTTKNIKLVKSSATLTLAPGENNTVTGLQGDGPLEGKELTVELVELAKNASGVLQGRFRLLDGDTQVGSDVTTGVSSNLKDLFQDSSGAYLLKSNLFIDALYEKSGSGAGTIDGWIEVTKGTDTVVLYDGKGYPYDSTYTGSTFDYKVSLTSSSNKFTSLEIYNSAERWYPDSDLGVLYPTNPGQSFNNKSGNSAKFLGNVPEGTVGKDYFSIEFVGFEADEEKTTIEIGNASAFSELNIGAVGGLKFKGKDGSPHILPLALKLSGSSTGATFTFDSKTIWYKVVTNAEDVSTFVTSRNVVNGRIWTITPQTALGTSNIAQVSVQGVGDFNVGVVGDLNTSPGTNQVAYFTVDGVQFHVSKVHDGNTSFVFDTNGYVIFRQGSNENGTVLSPATASDLGISDSDFNTTSNTYGKFYFTKGVEYDANVSPSNIALKGSDGTNDFRYTLQPPTTTESRIWLTLDADIMGEDESNVIQNNHVLDFKGTYVPFTGDAEAFGAENLVTHFVPKTPDYNTNTQFSNANAVYVASFKVNDASDTVNFYDYNVFVDALDGGILSFGSGSQLSGISYNIEYLRSIGGTTPGWGLSNNPSSPTAMLGAYSEVGARVWLDTENDKQVLQLPQNAEQVSLVVSGAETERTIEGEDLSAAEGETVESSSGTKITVNKINYTAEVVAGETDKEAETVEYEAAAGLGGRAQVVLDKSATGPVVVVGGHLVNSLAVGVTEDVLKASGDTIVDVTDSGNIIVAGYTAADTVKAAQDFIDLIEAGFA